MIELLSPAGNKESFIAAINAGADAIYMGINKYSARQMAQNFDVDEYIEAINYAHIFGVKIYLTLNTLLYTDEIKDALEIVLKLYNAGLDAVIIQDIGLAMIIKKYIPNLALHASTQMTVHSLKEVEYLKQLGFKRVVLARELTIEEIEYISKHTNVELEVFVHGALCVSFSGQCLMSSMIGNRSGNRGLCAGSCRLPISLYKENEKVAYGHLLSKKDIFGIDYIKRLEKIGIKSLKIEGRGKTKEYISLITRKYRKCIDGLIITKSDEEEMLQMFNRTSKSEGYFNGVKYKESITYKNAKNTGLILGKVILTKNKLIKIRLDNDIDMHDGIENEDGTSSTIVTIIKDEKGRIINKEAKKGDIVWLGDFKNVPKIGQVINKTSSRKLIESENNHILKDARKQDVVLDLTILKNTSVKVKCSSNNISFEIDFDIIPENSLNKSLTREYIEEVLNKNSNEYFKYIIEDITLDDGLFLPVSKINEIRRNISKKIIDSVIIDRKLNINFENLVDIVKSNKLKNTHEDTLFVYKLKESSIEKINKSKSKIIYINISDFRDLNLDLSKIKNKDIYIYLPNIVLSNLEKFISENLEEIIYKYHVKGILIGSSNYVSKCKQLKEKYNLKLVGDYSLNVNNIFSAKYYNEMGCDRITISPEVSENEIVKILGVMPVEIVTDMVTVMTTRYCVIKSFCGCLCKKFDFSLKDEHDKKYNIVTDTADCISKYVRNVPKKYEIKNSTQRTCIIS